MSCLDWFCRSGFYSFCVCEFVIATSPGACYIIGSICYFVILCAMFTCLWDTIRVRSELDKTIRKKRWLKERRRVTGGKKKELTWTIQIEIAFFHYILLHACPARGPLWFLSHRKLDFDLLFLSIFFVFIPFRFRIHYCVWKFVRWILGRVLDIIVFLW